MVKIGSFVKMKNYLVNIKVLLLIVLLSGVTVAQRFKASADKTVIGEGENFQVYFELDAQDINAAENFTAPTFKGFNILGGPNQSTSMQFINGRVSATLTFSFILEAVKPGKFTIGKAFITYKGKRYSTKPINITVVKSNRTGKRNVRMPARRNSPNGISDVDIARNVFIRAIPNKRDVFRGEQITITYRLYTRLNISSPSITKLPSYAGFWAEDLQMPNTISFRNEIYRGVRYRVADLKKVALFPTKSGKLKITPFELNIPVLIRRRSRSLFDDFFNDPFFSQTQTYNFKTKSNSVIINVKPLPKIGVPENFGGAVGRFNLISSINKRTVKTNEAITIKLKISGAGNINLIQIPKIKLPAGFEQYEPKVTFRLNKQDIISGSKTIEYLIIPRIPGKKIIPPITFSYFNPARHRYITLKTKPFIVKVEGEINNNLNNTAGLSKADVKLLNKDIRFIKTSNFRLVRISDESIIPIWFYWSLVLPLILLGLVVVTKKRHDKIMGNTQLVKSQKAERFARKRLKKARKALDEKKDELFYEEIYKALSGYLSDKLNIPVSDFTTERVSQLLLKLKVDPNLIDEVKSVIDKCEYARYAPSKDERAEENLYLQSLHLISNLEKAINKVKK